MCAGEGSKNLKSGFILYRFLDEIVITIQIGDNKMEEDRTEFYF